MPDDNQTTTQTSTDNADAFGNNQTTNQDTGTNVQNADQTFNQSVGEGKQYATQEDLAKGKLEADQFIEQLKTENKELREDISKRPTLDDVRDIMKLQDESQNATSSELDEEALNKIVDSRFENIQLKKTASGNIKESSDKMVSLYGAKANEQVAKKAEELGVTVEYLQDQAARSPAMFYSIMGVSEDASTQTVAGNQTAQGQNTEQFNKTQHGTKEGTWGYYEELRKEDPKKYFSPKVQNEMFQMRKEKSADFYK